MALFLTYSLVTVIVTSKPLKPTVREKIYVGTASYVGTEDQ
jgi:hypothetical protein